MAKTRSVLKVDGRDLEVSSLEKIFFPKDGFTKGQLIDYYIKVSPYLLPHLKDRPLTMKRYPDGVQGMFFYEKDAPSYTPAWVKTYAIARKEDNKKIRYLLVNDLSTLVWSANLANIELHCFLARAPKIQEPTSVVFDLDPGPPADILDCAQIALWLQEIFHQLKLESYAKVSGSKGIQMYVPLNTKVDYETTNEFAHAIATKLEVLQPDRVVSKMTKSLRNGKVFIDWGQNSDFKTTICVYSVRAKHETPFVSAPVSWEELAAALKQGEAAKLFFDPETVLKRLKKQGDLFEPLLTRKQKIPASYSKTLDTITSLKAGSASKPAKAKAKGTDINTYNAKRDFQQTKEPEGKKGAAAKSKSKNMFVIQKHEASRLHYDFRLEMEGVLRSWAVPKGPPASKGENRLAMHVEDHPMSYARFEGTIPKGNYGAGTVMVWDIGTYEVTEDTPERAYRSGKLHMILHGKKLAGEWVLVRGRKDKYGKEAWFLMKAGTNMKEIGPRKDDQSALTGRTMKQIETERTAEWKSNRTATS